MLALNKIKPTWSSRTNAS